MSRQVDEEEEEEGNGATTRMATNLSSFSAFDVRQHTLALIRSAAVPDDTADSGGIGGYPKDSIERRMKQQQPKRVHYTEPARAISWSSSSSSSSLSSVATVAARHHPCPPDTSSHNQNNQRVLFKFCKSSESFEIPSEKQKTTQISCNYHNDYHQQQLNEKPIVYEQDSKVNILNNIHQHSETMSQTIQSIQSLSIQLNRAASLNVGLDDAMTGSQEISARSTTADITNGNKFTKIVGKKTTRIKELFLQNLGKSFKTHDELFEMYEENFYKQQAQALKIHKEFKIYLNSLKVAQDANKSLNNCIQQSTGVYQSARHDLVCENLSLLENLNEDLLEKLRGQIQASLVEYLSQFNELREKILKRKRKLIDFDSSRRVYEITMSSIQRKRHQLQQQSNQQQQQQHRGFKSAFSRSSNSTNSIESAASQLVDEARLLKLREQYNYCKIMYESINSELYQELPMIYEKKMEHLLTTLQNYFSLEAQFHSNAQKLYSTAGEVIDKLPMSIHHQQQQNPLKKQQQLESGDEYNNKASGSSGMGSSRGDSSLESSSSPDNSVDDGSSPAATSPSPCIEQELKEEEPLEVDESVVGNHSGKDEEPAADIGLYQQESGFKSAEIVSDSVVVIDDSKKDDAQENGLEIEPNVSLIEGKSSKIEIEANVEAQVVVKEEEDKQDYLYKVKTSYKYLAEDVDELCFEADEIIQVIKFEADQEQEEGWLMGIREVNGQRGLFPANFTQPI